MKLTAKDLHRKLWKYDETVFDKYKDKVPETISLGGFGIVDPWAIFDWCLQKCHDLVCFFFSHEIEDDMCRKPEHRYCVGCNRRFPYAEVTK